jgi:hypothetical protein
MPAHFPAHTKHVAVADYDAALQRLGTEEEQSRFTYLNDLIFGDSLTVLPATKKVFFDLRPRDINDMEETDLIEEAPAGSEPNLCLFLVPEFAKHRARIIGFPRERNAAIAEAGYVADMPLKHPNQVAADVWSADVTVLAEITCTQLCVFRGDEHTCAVHDGVCSVQRNMKGVVRVPGLENPRKSTNFRGLRRLQFPSLYGCGGGHSASVL